MLSGKAFQILITRLEKKFLSVCECIRCLHFSDLGSLLMKIAIIFVILIWLVLSILFLKCQKIQYSKCSTSISIYVCVHLIFSSGTFYLLYFNVLDENHDISKDTLKEESSSPSKRTKNVAEPASSSVLLHRVPLSPRKDPNLSSPVTRSREQSSTPNTLPKTSLQTAGQHPSRTRRNLASSFASLTADCTLSRQQRCNSVDEPRDKTRVNFTTEVETKTNDDQSKSATVSTITLTTPSKPNRKPGTPSKAASKLSTLTTTPSKTPEKVSKHKPATLRLVKDRGILFIIC